MPLNDEACFKVVLGDGGPGFDAPPGQTLLQSAEQAGFLLANSCRVGTCRACMRQLVRGQVRYRIEWPGLLAEEKAQGWILPCAAYPATDLVLAGE